MRDDGPTHHVQKRLTFQALLHAFSHHPWACLKPGTTITWNLGLKSLRGPTLRHSQKWHGTAPVPSSQGCRKQDNDEVIPFVSSVEGPLDFHHITFALCKGAVRLGSWNGDPSKIEVCS